MALAFASGPDAGGADAIYRWVDAQGRVQFGDQPPPEGAERLEVAPAPAADTQLGQRRERGERLLDIMAEDRQIRDREKRAREQGADDRHARCDNARKRQSQAADANYIFHRTQDPANPRVLDEMERQKFEQDLQAEVKLHCGNHQTPE